MHGVTVAGAGKLVRLNAWVSEALDIAFRALVNPGDKVMFHQPCYVSYSPSITLVHGEAIPVPTYA
ncbi:MAG TPA: aminotransferase class I/II-fold pyridoxal phosphate-dependent enzyme, partial [Verrucomicrobiae bacterium]